MADNFTNSEIGRKLSDWISRDDSGRSFMYDWTTSNTAVDLPTAPGVTTPVPSLRMIVDPVTGVAGELANGVASVKLIANTVTGQVTVANGRAQAASDSANVAATWAATSGNYSNVAGVRADTARVYMEQTRDLANGVTITNAVVTNAALGVASNTTLVLTTKGQIDLLATTISVMNTTVTANKQSVDLVNTSVWTAKGLIDTVNTNVNTSKTAAATSATNAETANTNAWTARLQANSAAANAIAANTNVYVALGTTLTLLSQANTANAGAWQAKLATDNNVVTAGNYAAQAGVYASAINPANYVTISSLTWANTTGKPSIFPTDIANVSGLSAALATKADDTSVNARIAANVSTINGTISGKLDASAFTWSGLSGKPTTFAPSAHTHTIAEVVSLQGTLDGKLTANPGITTGFAAFSVNSLGVDSYLGDGQLNLMGGAVHARTANATATGHLYITSARGASRVGLHDNAINLYVSNTSSGTAGQSVTWQQVTNITNAVVNHLVQPQFNGVNLTTSADLASKANLSGATFTGNVQFPSGVLVGSGVSTGLYGDGGNVAIRGYSSGLVYIQTQSGGTTMATFGSSAANIYQPLTITGNLTTTGSVFVGSAGGLFSSGNHRLVFDAATGNRVSYRSDSAAAAGINLQTNDGVHRGALYYDGNLGLLNQNNGWRFRTSSGAASVYTDAGTEYSIYTSGNLSPMTTNTAQTLAFGVLKEFVTVAGNVWSSASPGNTYANALGVKGAGGASDSAVISFHRPNYYATHFGLDQNNRFSVGGWSMGDVRRQLWIDGQIPTSVWQSSDDAKQRFYFGANDSTIYKSPNYHLWYNASNGQTMTLDQGGTLSLAGEIVTPGWIRITGSNGLYWNAWGGGWNMSDATWMRSYGDKNIVTGGTVQMGAFTVTSDRRLKTDIVALTGAASILDQTNVYQFTKAGRRMYGVIAQEVRQIAPILVSEGADLHPVDGDPILSVDLTGYVPLLIDEVKSLRARVAMLEVGS